MLSVRTKLRLPVGEEVFLEAGAGTMPEHSYVIGLTARPQFLDGSALSQRVLAEDGKPPWLGMEHLDTRRIPSLRVADGMVLSFWPIEPRVFGLVPVRDTKVEVPMVGVEKIATPDGVLGVLAGDVVYDLRAYLRSEGITLPKDGYAYFNRSTSRVVSMMNEASLEKMAKLAGPHFEDRYRAMRLSATVVQWDGVEPEAGRLPARLVRLARDASLAAQGVRYTTHLGTMGEAKPVPDNVSSGGDLVSGIGVEAEAWVSPDGSFSDLRVFLELRTDLTATWNGATVLPLDRPVFVPLGSAGGERIGVVWHAFATDGRGVKLEGLGDD